MGYVSRDIAVITEPGKFTLSGSSNFVQFASKPNEKTYLEARIYLHKVTGDVAALTALTITDPAGDLHVFRGTDNPGEVGGNIFFVSSETSETIENLRGALMSDRWLNANFELVIPFLFENGHTVNGTVLHMRSKGAGKEFNIEITGTGYYEITWVNKTSKNNDSISGEAMTADIKLDVYTDADILPGKDDAPTDVSRLGRYLTSLQKTYAGVPMWFDMNGIFTQFRSHNLPSDTPGWFDAGTSRAYRFVAKVGGYSNSPFYQSNVLYVVNGRGEPSDLAEYVFDGGSVRLLTSKPATTYVRGQREFLNFILSFRAYYTFKIAYQVFTTSDTYIGTIYDHEITSDALHVVNTCRLNIDAVLDKFPTAAIVRVALWCGGAIVSNSLEYQIRPECLHTLRQFTFLNRLGGWETFNFDAPVKDDIKSGVETFNRTLTPSHRKGDSIETVQSVTLNNVYTIEGAPVTDAVAVWLKELAGAHVVLDGNGKYVIQEGFTLQISDSARNMQKPTLKYRYDNI